MNTVRTVHLPFLRTARLVLLAALSAGTLGLSGCGGGVSVGVGIGIDAGSHDAPPTVSMSMSTASGAGGTTVRLTASPWDDYAVTQVDFEMVYPGGAVQHLGSVRRPPWVLSPRTMSNSAWLSPKPSTYSSRTASGLARKILVTLCSTIVRPIGWRSTSDGLCVSKMPSPFCLRMVFCFCLAKSLKTSWSSAFQNSGIT